MSVPAPVNGNQNFTHTTGNSNFSEINASKLNIGGNAQVGRHNGGALTLNTVYGYSTSDFVGATAATVHAFNSAPNLPAATAATDSDILRIPVNSVVREAQIIMNGTSITGTISGLDIGTGSFGGTSTNIFDDVTRENINSGAVVWGNDGNTALATGGSIGVTSSTNVINYTIKAAAATAGNFVVAITYSMVPQFAAELLGN